MYHVLYLDHAADMGGAEYSLLEVLRQLKAQRIISPIVATAEDGAFALQLEDNGIDVLPLNIPAAAGHFAREKANRPLAVFQQIPYWTKPYQQIIDWIKENPIDLIHSNTLKMHVVGSFVSRATGKPLIWHMRDIPGHRGNATRILKGASMIHRPEGIITISKAVKASLDGLQGSCFTETIHNGLDLDHVEIHYDVSLQAMRQRLGLPSRGRLILCVGYFIPWKGQDILIQAFAQLYKKHPDWHLVFMGKPIFQYQQEEERLIALTRTLGVRQNTHFLGEQHNIVDKMRAFEVFVCPSTREPFGRVILEAMAAKIPIVATNAGGIPEIVRHNQEAVLVEPSNPTQLAQGIETMMTDKAFALNLVDAGYKRLLEKFTLNQTIRGILNAYQKISPKN